MNKDDLFKARFDDLAAKALREGVSHSRFLTPGEAESARQMFARRRDVQLVLDGGFPDAERLIAALVNPLWGAYRPEGALCALKITFRRQDSLSHRDILGATLALGISRDTLGDIEIADGEAFLVCAAGVAGFIAENLEQAGRVGLEVCPIPLSLLPGKTVSLAQKADTVPSMRLDAVLCSAFNLSRAQALEYIKAGSVQLRHRECLNPSQQVDEGDIFSIRGLGRGKVTEIHGLTRKGRLRIQIGIFI